MAQEQIDPLDKMYYALSFDALHHHLLFDVHGMLIDEDKQIKYPNYPL
jgi:hypothetical protein